MSAGSSVPAEALIVTRLERNLQYIVDAEAGKRCLECAHIKHNELGYCQVGQCSCDSGATLASTAAIIRRDLPEYVDAKVAAALPSLREGIVAEALGPVRELVRENAFVPTDSAMTTPVVHVGMLRSLLDRLSAPVQAETLVEHAKTCGGCWRCDIGQPAPVQAAERPDPVGVAHAEGRVHAYEDLAGELRGEMRMRANELARRAQADVDRLKSVQAAEEVGGDGE